MSRLSSLPAFLIVLFCTADFVRGDVKLPAVLDSHMVMQRDVPLKIWGTADPGETVTVAQRLIPWRRLDQACSIGGQTPQ